MPIIKKCPFCDFQGNHGFHPAFIGTIAYYHTIGNKWNSPVCRHYVTEDGKIFKTDLQAFRNIIKIKNIKDDIWIEAMIAKMEGKERKAQRLFKQWNKEYL